MGRDATRAFCTGCLEEVLGLGVGLGVGLGCLEEVRLTASPHPRPGPCPTPRPEPEQACLISSLHGLTHTQTREADRWVELYEHHDKYRLVGRLREYVTMPPARPPARPPPVNRSAAAPHPSHRHSARHVAPRRPPPGLGDQSDEAAPEAAKEPPGPETPDEWELEQVQAAQRAEQSKKHKPFKAPMF